MLELCGLEAAPDGATTFTLQWVSAPGRRYDVLRATDVSAGGWTIIANRVPATASELRYTDPDATGRCYYYRIRLSP